MLSNKIPYPNRKLGFEFAMTAPHDAFDCNCRANLALANLLPGEVIPLPTGHLTVKSITAKRLTLVGADGVIKVFSTDTPRWPALVREVGGLILSSHHGVDGGDLVKALLRDPVAFRNNRGIIELKSEDTAAFS